MIYAYRHDNDPEHECSYVTTVDGDTSATVRSMGKRVKQTGFVPPRMSFITRHKLILDDDHNFTGYLCSNVHLAGGRMIHINDLYAPLPVFT
jgi:hypothetical protein